MILDRHVSNLVILITTMIEEQQIALKNGRQITLRPPQLTDVEFLLAFTNEISREDTFITLSGEVLTREEEERYLRTATREIEMGNRIQLFAFDQNKLVANVDIHRVTRFRKRCKHVGEVAISILKDFRGVGLGTKLLQILIDQARKVGFRLLILDAFSENTPAFILYEKMGFIKAGEIPGAIWYKDRYIGQVHMYLPLK